MWSNLMYTLHEILQNFPPPDVLIIHLGGNDIGKLRTLDIVFQIRDDLLRIKLSFPDTVIIFSEVIQRLSWCSLPSLRPLEKVRRRINRAVSKLLSAVGIFSFRHTELEGLIVGLYRSDGVHLSEVGLDIFNANLGTCVELAAVWGGW